MDEVKKYLKSEVVRRFDTKVLVIRDMLHLFIDSQIRINEARPLIKEITNSLPRDMSVIVSLSRVPSPQYKMLFPCFDRFIDVRSSHKTKLMYNAFVLVLNVQAGIVV